MNTKNTKQSATVFIINLQKRKQVDGTAHKKNNQPDVVICLAFSQQKTKDKEQRTKD